MKEYKSGGERRLWYDPDEIESIALDELARASLLPRVGDDDVSVDIEALVEKHLKLPLDQYAELPSNVLGVTTFLRGRLPQIALNRDLTGTALDVEDAAPGLLGRWRATLAHEVAHVLLHRILYELDDLQAGLFSATASARSAAELHRCLKRDVGFGRQVRDWKEVQANMGMGALLMPKPLVLDLVRVERHRIGVQDQPVLAGSSGQEALVSSVSRRFKVSKEAAGIRLAGLSIIQPAQQRAL